MSSPRTRRRAAALATTAMTAGLTMPAVVAGPAAATSDLTVAAVVPYAVGGPTTVVPLSFGVDHDTGYVHLRFDGLIAGAECAAGADVVAVEAAGGTAVITTDLTAGTDVDCSVSLVELFEVAPEPTVLAVIESDDFNVELARAESTVSFTIVEPELLDGALSLASDTYHPYEPRRVGDVLRAEFEVALAGYALSATTADENDIACETSAGTISCEVSRELTADDLIAGVADLSAIVHADGFPVVDTARAVAVYAEHRIEVVAGATPAVLRAGELTTVTATVTNVGTTALSDIAVAGAGVTAYTCAPSLSGLVLQPGASTTCSGTHRATAAAAADPASLTPVTARGTAPFGSDADLSDDDPTSPDDVDGSSLLPYTVSAAEVAGHVTLDGPVVLVPNGGPGTRTLDVAIDTVGALADPVVVVPHEPAPGVTVSCAVPTGDHCTFPLDDLAAGGEASLELDVELDPGALGSARFAALALPVRLEAAGGVDVLLGTATLATAGAVATMSTAPRDAGGADAIATFTIDTEAGAPVRLTLSAVSVPSTGTGARVASCRTAAGTPVALTVAGTAVTTAPIAPASRISCSVSVPVDDTIRRAGSVAVTLQGEVSAGGRSAPLTATGTLPLGAVTVRPLPTSAVPAQGYVTRADGTRPDRVRQAFRVTAWGTAKVASLVADGSDVTVACGRMPVGAPGAPKSVDCTVEHRITDGDLRAGSAVLGLTARGSTGGVALSARGTRTVATPHQAVAVRVTELSAPVSGTYTIGEQVRLLLHVTNTGTLPVQVTSTSVVRSHAASPGSTLTGTRGPVVGACTAPAALAAGAGTECALTVTLAPEDIGVNGALLAASVATAQGVGASTPVVLGQAPRTLQLTAGTMFELAVGGRAGVAADARAVAINLTAVDPAAAGFLTVWDCAPTMPPTSNVNFQAGGATASLVIAETSGSGTVCIYTSTDVDLVADVSGFVPDGSGYVAIAPDRRLDSRLTARPAGGDVVSVGVVGGGVPADAGAVVLSVAAVDPSADGHTTVWPCGQPRPGTSTINFHAGITRANLALIQVGDGGQVCIASSASTDLVVDVLGAFPTDGSFTPVVPRRLADTRSGAQPHADQVLEIVAPAGAVAVALNVAVTNGSAPGFAAVWPCGGTRPATSSVNFLPGTTVANAVIAPVGAGGKVCVATSAPADLVVDLTGVFTGTAAYRALPPQRILDTR